MCKAYEWTRSIILAYMKTTFVKSVLNGTLFLESVNLAMLISVNIILNNVSGFVMVLCLHLFTV